MDFYSEEEPKTAFRGLPSPPAFLVERQKQALAGQLLNDPIHHLDLIETRDIPVQEDELPDHIDVSLYKLAIQERKAAEMNYAEIYSKYIEVMAFNERLLKHLRHQEMYRFRVRQVYDRLKYGDDNIMRVIHEMREEIARYKKDLSELNTENKALKISLGSFEEAFNNVNARLQESQNQHQLAERQFQILAEEFTQRGYLLAEAEDKIKDHVERIERMNQIIGEIQNSNQQLRDDNLVFKSKLQDANQGTPNTEIGTLLANSVQRLQEKLLQIEAQSHAEKEQSQNRIRELEERLMQLQSQPTLRQAPPPQVQELYQRWDSMISELSSLSKPIREEDFVLRPPSAALLSESGEITT